MGGAARSVCSDTVPFYNIYGVPVRGDAVATLHVERVQDRHALHGGRVEAHRHPHLYQFSLWRGGGDCQMDGVRQPFAQHALTIMPPTVAHGFQIGPDADAVVISLSAAYAAVLRSEDAAVPWPLIDRPTLIELNEEAYRDILALFEAIEAEYRRPRRYGREAIAGHVRLLVIAFARLRGADRRDDGDGLVDAFLALVNARLRERWPIKRYVDALNTSAYQLNRAARRSFGRSAIELVRERTAIEAQRLLLFSKMSAGEIGFMLGFDDPAHFGRFFQRQTGQSPTVWRRCKTDFTHSRDGV